jgi:hypothetical protein
MAKLSAMILPSIFPPSVHWMSWGIGYARNARQAFLDQVDNYSRLSIYKIRGENCANRSHGQTIAPIVLLDNQVPSA